METTITRNKNTKYKERLKSIDAPPSANLQVTPLVDLELGQVVATQATLHAIHIRVFEVVRHVGVCPIGRLSDLVVGKQ